MSAGLEALGTSGGFDRLHFLLERAFDGADISLYFLKVSSAPSCCVLRSL